MVSIRVPLDKNIILYTYKALFLVMPVMFLVSSLGTKSLEAIKIENENSSLGL